MARAAISLALRDNGRPKVLVARPDGRGQEELIFYLAGRGYDARRVFAPSRASPAALPPGFDLVVIEVAGRGDEGVAFCRKLASGGFPAVIVVCEAMTAANSILCLELGADDAIAGPVGYRELAARISAVLRGRSRPRATGPVRKEWRLGGCSFNAIDRMVRSSTGASTRLSNAESMLLRVFLDNQGLVLSRDEITRRTGANGVGCGRVVDVHVARLRRRLAGCEGVDWTIRTLRGVGYRFEANQAAPRDRIVRGKAAARD